MKNTNEGLWVVGHNDYLFPMWALEDQMVVPVEADADTALTYLETVRPRILVIDTRILSDQFEVTEKGLPALHLTRVARQLHDTLPIIVACSSDRPRARDAAASITPQDYSDAGATVFVQREELLSTLKELNYLC